MYYLQSSLAFKTVVSAQNEETTSNKNNRRSEIKLNLLEVGVKCMLFRKDPRFMDITLIISSVW